LTLGESPAPQSHQKHCSGTGEGELWRNIQHGLWGSLIFRKFSKSEFLGGHLFLSKNLMNLAGGHLLRGGALFLSRW